MALKAKAGFTLVETLVALILVTAVALPASLWFYRSRMNQAAIGRFHALQILEKRMNRAVLGRRDKSIHESLPGPFLNRIEIQVTQQGDENLLTGMALDSKGKVLATLKTSFFDRGGP